MGGVALLVGGKGGRLDEVERLAMGGLLSDGSFDSVVIYAVYGTRFSGTEYRARRQHGARRAIFEPKNKLRLSKDYDTILQ